MLATGGARTEAGESATASESAAHAREITDDDIRRMEARIGVQQPQLTPFNEFATQDAVRHFAEGIGDDNPLYADATYARNTRWGGIIAPPYFLDTMGVSRVAEIRPDVRERGRGALSGIHGWYSGDTMRFYLPVHVGDRLWVRIYISDVKVKPSEFAGRTVHYVRRQEYTNQRAELVATVERYYIAGGREKKPEERSKYAAVERAHWSPEQIEEIAAEYRSEQRRGSEPRYWEDVDPGEELPRRLKGPLVVTDMIRFDMGRGSPYIRAHKFAYAARDRHPNAYPIDEEYGIPDVVERVHWSEGLARQTGNPAPYDYGAQRVSWLCQVATDWMGDDGWLSAMHVDLKKFNYVGDLTYCYGTVESKDVRNGAHCVRLRLWGVDQRGRTTCEGWGEVALPSRSAGPVMLTVVPDRVIVEANSSAAATGKTTDADELD